MSVCRCDCKELDNYSSCNNDYLWSPSTCECECQKKYANEEYLDIKICSCEKLPIGQ